MAGGEPRNHALDGLRGWAAVAVVFYHSILGANPALITGVLWPSVWAQRSAAGVAEKLALSVLSGEMAVQVFFAISGVVLYRSFCALGTGGPVRTSWVFALRRFTRIWPVMAVALLGTFAVRVAVHRALPGVAVQSLSALRRNLLLSEYGVIGATWTLHAELAMVPALLACFFAVRRFGRIALLGCSLYALAALREHILAGTDVLLAYALPFALGGVAVECGMLGALHRSRWAAPVAAGAALGLVSTYVFLPLGGVRVAVQIVPVTVAVGWVAAAPHGRVRRALEAPLSRLLGRLSYSLYLWNVLVFWILLALVGEPLDRAYPLPVGLAVGAAATLVTLPLAALSERWLERPCIALGRTLSRRQPARSLAPTGTASAATTAIATNASAGRSA
jgi:peptidoglycan/LPS O-acetylase OafA/YrhL